MTDPLFIAHRGASYLAPENTLRSVNLAWRLGADAVEVDVRLTSDEKVVVIHDADTLRTTGEKWVVAQTPFAQLSSLSVLSLNGEPLLAENIPSLSQVYATVPPLKQLFVEIKCSQEIIAPLAALALSPQVVRFITFDWPLAERLKRAFPAFRVYLLAEKGSHDKKHLLEACQHMALDGVDVSADYPINGDDVARLQRAGKETFVWTVDDPLMARNWLDKGVNGITTNRPAWLKNRVLGEEE